MAYKLAEEDKLCGIEYPTYEGFKPIPKATCDMLKPQCNDIEIVLNCDKKKEEEKPTPTPTPQPEPTPEPQPEPSPTPNPEEPQPTPQPQPEEPKPQPQPEEPKPQPQPEEPTPEPDPVDPTPEPDPAPKPVLTNEELDTIVSGKLGTNTTLGNYYVNQNNTITLIGDAPLEDIEAYKKEITDKVGDIPELKDYTVEVLVNKIPGDNVGDKATGAPLYTKVVKITKPNGEVYQSEPMSIGTTTETNIDLLEALPRVEDKFSKIIAKDGQVVEVPEVSNDDKRAFEDKIINDLKAKLPEGTVVEAVLEGPKYEKGSEVLSGKTNYVLNVRTTLNGVVSEQTYNVPHTEEAPKEEPEAPDENIERAFSNINFGNVIYDGDLITDIRENYGASNLGNKVKESDLPRIGEILKNSVEEHLNRGLTGDNVYKVNDFTVKMNYKVGEHKPWSESVFSFTAKITKPNGEVVTKKGNITSGAIDNL